MVICKWFRTNCSVIIGRKIISIFGLILAQITIQSLLKWYFFQYISISRNYKTNKKRKTLPPVLFLWSVFSQLKYTVKLFMIKSKLFFSDSCSIKHNKCRWWFIIFHNIIMYLSSVENLMKRCIKFYFIFFINM